MASTLEYAEYLLGQLEGAGEVRYRKMFGEYGFYIDEKYTIALCDNLVYLKITKEGEALLREKLGAEPVKAPPYEGASLCFLIEDPENRELLVEAARVTSAALPAPKPKKPKKKDQ